MDHYQIFLLEFIERHRVVFCNHSLASTFAVPFLRPERSTMTISELVTTQKLKHVHFPVTSTIPRTTSMSGKLVLLKLITRTATPQTATLLNSTMLILLPVPHLVILLGKSFHVKTQQNEKFRKRRADVAAPRTASNERVPSGSGKKRQASNDASAPPARR